MDEMQAIAVDDLGHQAVCQSIMWLQTALLCKRD